MLLGVHVSGVKHIYEAADAAHGLGCNTMQIFSRSPQQWRKSRLDRQVVQEFIRRRKQFGIDPVFIHIPYLINLASPNPRLYKASIEAYIEDIREAEALQADYIITHMGSHKETSEEEGLARLAESLNIIIARTQSAGVGILLENTAGSGSWLGYKFSHQRAIMSAVERKERLGLCLDTAHAFLAGYDLASQEGLHGLLDEIDREVGLSFLKLVHLNDAFGALGSRHDRHAHLGKGNIGLEGIKRIINHPQLKNLAFILETPKDSKSADKANLATVRRLRR